MAQNPLQQYFRQPKIYISLPSQGAYSREGAITGDVTNVPIYSMTGMDEIIVKTPDALLSGESTVKVVESCCPNVKNAWELSVLDTDLIFAAIRVATYGKYLSVSHTCTSCGTSNDYDLDLTRVVEHYTACKYNDTIVLKDFTIKTKPLNYKQLTNFNLKNFELQQKLSQAEKIEDKEEQQKNINELWRELAESQHNLYLSSIESVEVNGQLVVEKNFINEWLANCDKSVLDAIKTQMETNKTVWQMPMFPVKCGECEAEIDLTVDLDQSNFFV
jgi:hypothetical protein